MFSTCKHAWRWHIPFLQESPYSHQCPQLPCYIVHHTRISLALVRWSACSVFRKTLDFLTETWHVWNYHHPLSALLCLPPSPGSLEWVERGRKYPLYLRHYLRSCIKSLWPKFVIQPFNQSINFSGCKVAVVQELFSCSLLSPPGAQQCLDCPARHQCGQPHQEWHLSR